jgi:hypothetical protein
MPSLTRKVIKGRSYYYLRHCQRMDGRPKIVKTTYLGSTEQVLARLATPALRPQPRAVEIATLGDVAALYDVAHQLDLVALIDAHLPKREQGLSVGQYLLLAALNRAAHPTSKAGLADWYQRTVLPRLVPASPGQLSSQAFWNHMERVTQGCAHITLIFDKGNNSHEAFENLDGSGFHFVGSLVSTQHPDLLAIPQRRYGSSSRAVNRITRERWPSFNVFARATSSGAKAHSFGLRPKSNGQTWRQKPPAA